MGGASAEGGGEDRRPVAVAFDACFEPLAALVRGTAVESVHRGVLAVVDEAGDLRGGVGDPGVRVLLRSAAKPFQAAAVIASGAADALSLDDEEIALIAASHSGAPEHVAVAARLLERSGSPASALVCGPPEHMCSGKHAGMLVLAAHLGVSGTGYHHEEHPVQKTILAYIDALLQTAPRPRCAAAATQATPEPRAVFAGIDGCGVPVIAMSLADAAWLFAGLAAGATPELARVRDAMTAHPVLVAGEGRPDTSIIRAGAGSVVGKGGAEAVQGVGVRRPASEGGAIGLALKMEDGSARAIPALVRDFLRAWDLGDAAAVLERAHPPVFMDTTGREVARIAGLAEPGELRRKPSRGGEGDPPARAPLGSEPPGETGAKRGIFGKKGGHVTESRGDEKDVLRFLREQWPDVDREYFGRAVEWVADPYALVYRRDRAVVAVLRGHFVGGLASVDELMVGEGARGQGLGSLLLGRFEDEAVTRKCSRIVLRAVKGTRAEDFYRKRGYHRECVQYGYEFGYDYVRLTCDIERVSGESGGPV